MSSSNVIIPSCHYCPVPPPHVCAKLHLISALMRTRLAHTLTGHPQKRDRKKKNICKYISHFYTGGTGDKRALWGKSLQINLGNVSFNKNAAGFVGDISLSTWSKLTDLNICASTPSAAPKCSLYLSPRCRNGGKQHEKQSQGLFLQQKKRRYLNSSYFNHPTAACPVHDIMWDRVWLSLLQRRTNLK